MSAKPAAHRTAATGRPRAALPRTRDGDRLVEQVLRLAGDRARLLRHGERPWASATFSGTRHQLVLGYAGAAAVAQGERLIALLPDHEFAIRGQLVAYATIAAADHRLWPEPGLELTCELLLLEEV